MSARSTRSMRWIAWFSPTLPGRRFIAARSTRRDLPGSVRSGTSFPAARSASSGSCCTTACAPSARACSCRCAPTHPASAGSSTSNCSRCTTARSSTVCDRVWTEARAAVALLDPSYPRDDRSPALLPLVQTHPGAPGRMAGDRGRSAESRASKRRRRCRAWPRCLLDLQAVAAEVVSGARRLEAERLVVHSAKLR